MDVNLRGNLQEVDAWTLLDDWELVNSNVQPYNSDYVEALRSELERRYLEKPGMCVFVRLAIESADPPILRELAA